MKSLSHLVIKLSLCALLLIFSACSGEDGGDSGGVDRTVDSGTAPGATLTTLAGVVADGYLRDARVFLDRNANRRYDNGEPTVRSGGGGAFSLEVNSGEGLLYPVLVDVIAGQTVDEDSGTAVGADYLLEAPPGRWEFVSPLTTLVKIEQEKNPGFTEQQAVLSVRSQLGIADDVSPFVDYIDSASSEPAGGGEYSLTHKAARVVARLMGRLRSAVELNLGGTVSDEEQALVAYLISDQVMARAGLIKQALDAERNDLLVADVDALVAAVSEEISLNSLNAELLELYRQRVEQGLELWDMQPPQLLSRAPAAGDSVPVDAVITLEFDELLDETLLGTSLIELYGPGGAAVAGNLSYDAEAKQLVFVPDQVLLPFSDYQVVVSGNLCDVLGNPIGQDQNWSFSTIFDQSPPPLPDF